MSLISISQVFGLLLSGYLAQKLGIRSVFIACAGALALISAIGYLTMHGRHAAPEAPPASAQANAQSTAASQES
jgi:MFS family permease